MRALLLTFLIGTANATGTPPPPEPAPKPVPVSQYVANKASAVQTQHATATSSATAGAQAQSTGGAGGSGGAGGAGGLGGMGGSATGGGVDMSLAVNPVTGGGNTYVAPPPASAAPLPSGLCPKGDSEAWSIGWSFISYARSSTRTEHECLDKLLAYMRETIPKAPEKVINYVAGPPEIKIVPEYHTRYIYLDPPVVKKPPRPARKTCPAGQALVCKPNGAP